MDARVEALAVSDPRTSDPWGLVAACCDTILARCIADVSVELSDGADAIVESVLAQEAGRTA
jgi:hypothetical protein